MYKTLFRLLFALSPVFSAESFAASTEIAIQVPSGSEIHSQRYAAKGRLLAVFLTGEHGWNEYEYQAGAYLARQGIETWVADFIGPYFLPPGMSNVRKVPNADLADWLEQARRKIGKREIVLIAPGHMGQAALRMAEAWKLRHGKHAAVRGAVLLYPLLYDDIEPGQEPEYDRVVRSVRLDIALIQPQAAAGYWWRERLKATLESAGSRVQLTVQPGLRDGYYRRGDATPEELEAGGRLGELLHEQIKLLKGKK